MPPPRVWCAIWIHSRSDAYPIRVHSIEPLLQMHSVWHPRILETVQCIQQTHVDVVDTRAHHVAGDDVHEVADDVCLQDEHTFEHDCEDEVGDAATATLGILVVLECWGWWGWTFVNQVYIVGNARMTTPFSRIQYVIDLTCIRVSAAAITLILQKSCFPWVAFFKLVRVSRKQNGKTFNQHVNSVPEWGRHCRLIDRLAVASHICDVLNIQIYNWSSVENVIPEKCIRRRSNVTWATIA